MLQLLLEATIVGILTIIIGSLVGYGISKFVSSDLPEVCKNWNKFYIMEITLFLTGFLIHLLCEAVGVNKWYCKNGFACKKNK